MSRSREGITLVARAFLWGGAVSILTSGGALRHAELSVRLESESRLACAGVVAVAKAIAAHYRTCWEAKASQVAHMVGKAHAGVRRRTEAINALIFADGIAFSKVVNVSLITFAAHLNA